MFLNTSLCRLDGEGLQNDWAVKHECQLTQLVGHETLTDRQTDRRSRSSDADGWRDDGDSVSRLQQQNASVISQSR